ncbi:Acyl-CoA reductase (LuxC) [Marisediminitalea aggregata]|uniref:Acyl-CoA reductase (LuxC) n=1 Tax=Marisediminitalea aggregata TaxID=634436 RepID=A0A1M5GPP3_9ALTE|nr:acyl-CoA reductase [Marisediminitalea aggregata]SHG05663.1 Acyl-CoA reductase (LuxC) [Marisediminitalea aggregata]
MDKQNLFDSVMPATLSLDDLLTQPPMPVASQSILNFIQALSDTLLKDPACRAFPDVVALGFWLRDGNIKRLVKQINSSAQQALIKPVGTVVHYTPNNVDTMFLYSWVCALLMGNRNVVRLGSADSPAKQMLLTCLERLFSLPEHADIAFRNLFVQGAKSDESNHALAQVADARVLWGGDDSVLSIKQYQAKPRCRDISFADRYSAVVINGDELTDGEQLNTLCELLWQDAKPYAQQACSSPRVLFWLGDKSLQGEFARLLNEQAIGQDTAPSDGISRVNEHLVMSQWLQCQSLADAPLVMNRVSVIPVHQINAQMMEMHCGDALFLMRTLDTLNDLADCLPARVQTLTYWGVERDALLKLLAEPSIQGVDRCVSVGKALTFSPEWDGYRLLVSLSRYVQLDWG